ncbi:CPBP family intramembrane metalloprotease [Actinoplanes sichuanensis]|uniref:CPBP family intramembrane glutamic endopeptidase n=1 Tax=Actinoplanes sichuanensis TaxID=512349 RepID=A0ABW4AMS4_9ACTN|nr:CPBP family intramembrane glutamic endopeptidase [Actinoplanes sichuanensis]BEL08250.1 CPBP family intramembrane metalloprotease [Actinoplanes sichuanensis]
MTLVVVLLIMLAVRVWNRHGPDRSQSSVGPLAAILLVLVSGVDLTPGDWRYAVGAALAMAALYGILLLIPAGREALAARSYDHPVRKALIGVPLATVIFEEVAFRGVLWALIADEHGVAWATVVTAVLFGLWHLPDRGEVAFTTLAGVVLSFLRAASGGLLAPFVLHWTANGLGILASAWVRRSAPTESGDPEKS